MTPPTRVLLGVVGLVVGGLAVLALREATLSTHQPVLAGSRVAVVIDVDTRNREQGQDEAEMVEALVTVCRLEVSSDIVGEVHRLADGLYRAVLQPTLDQTNRRQFRGCLEDWTLDGLKATVVSLEEETTP